MQIWLKYYKENVKNTVIIYKNVTTFKNDDEELYWKKKQLNVQNVSCCHM